MSPSAARIGAGLLAEGPGESSNDPRLGCEEECEERPGMSAELADRAVSAARLQRRLTTAGVSRQINVDAARVTLPVGTISSGRRTSCSVPVGSHWSQ